MAAGCITDSDTEYYYKKRKFQIIDLMVECKLTASKTEARSVIQQGELSINDAKVESINLGIILKS